MTLSRRSHKPELLDLGPPHYTTAEYQDCLVKLGQIGRTLGGDRATLSAFAKLDPPPTSILDVGCGGGDFAHLLARTYPAAQVTGIDLDGLAIEYAQSHPPLPNLHFEQRTEKALRDPDNAYDVVTATLVCHHMNDEELVSFLKKSAQIARRAVILNDLHRSPLTTLCFATYAPLAFRNRLITHDGLLSIRRAFTRTDWRRYLDAADLHNATIEWHWGFRWIVQITTSSS